MSNSEHRSRTCQTNPLSRRSFLACASGLGLTSAVMSETLWAQVSDDTVPQVTKEMLQEAEHLAREAMDNTVQAKMAEQRLAADKRGP